MTNLLKQKGILRRVIPDITGRIISSEGQKNAVRYSMREMKVATSTSESFIKKIVFFYSLLTLVFMFAAASENLPELVFALFVMLVIVYMVAGKRWRDG